VRELELAVGKLTLQDSRRDAVVGKSQCIGATQSLQNCFVKVMTLEEQNLIYLLASSEEIRAAAKEINWTGVQVNCGVSKWHQDTGNVGRSMIIALGKFTGGEFLQGTKSYNIAGGALVFDGSVCE
jgi:hypothetical protein